MQNNLLKTLDGGGKLSDLQLLTELDLSNNEIQQLPSEFSLLTSLKVVCVIVSRYPFFQSLLLTNNRLQVFPFPVLHLKSLITLNLEGK